jgi:TolB protein
MEPTDIRSRLFSSRLLKAAAGVLLGIPAQAWTQAPPPAPGQPAQIIITGAGGPRFAIPDCVPRAGDEASREACRTLAQVLRTDLRFEFPSQQFVPEGLLTAIPAMNPDAPNMKDWESVGAGVLVVIRAAVTGGEMNVDVKVLAVPSGQTMLAKRYSGKPENPRVFAHQASDDIMSVAQLRGVARSKIAFVSDRDATKEKRGKELYIMDYDGFNVRRVTVNGSLNLVPSWSPDGKSIAYVSYRPTPDIFLASIYEGKSANLTNGKGVFQALSVAFSPDGKRIAFASNRSGNMDIWVASADGSGARKVTTSSASDTAPCWSPTGQEIGFTSNRGGTPQIYVMDAEGLNVRRLTNVGNYNDGCAWNPSKEFPEVAYTSRLEGGFEVAVLDIASGQVRQITQGRGSCEYPAWAPNGRHLAFACNRSGSWQITVSNRDGSEVNTLAAGAGNNVQPDWGP